MATVILYTAEEPPPVEVVDDLPDADLVVAADGGYRVAQALGRRVDVVVGDLDSVTAEELDDHVLVERHPANKDSTDLELALELVLRDTPNRVVVVGGSGGRLDHELALAGLLCSPRWYAIEEIDWISGRGRAYVVRGARQLHGDVGATVSLIAMGGEAGEVHTRGMKWQLAGESIPSGATLGVSNVLTAPVIEVVVGSGCLLAVFPEG